LKKQEKVDYYIIYNSHPPFGIHPVKGYIIEISGTKYGLHYSDKIGGVWGVTHLPTGANIGKHKDKNIAIEIATKNLQRSDAEEIIQDYIDKIKGAKLKLKFPINELT